MRACFTQFLCLTLLVAALGCAEPAPAPPRPQNLEAVHLLIQEVIEKNRLAVVENPRNHNVWGDYASALGSNGFLEEAALAFEVASTLDKNGSRWTFLHAVILREKPAAAVEILSSLPSAAFTDAEVNIFAGKMHEALGEQAAAISYYDEAHRLEPLVVEYLVDKARVQIAIEDQDGALESLSEAQLLGVKIDPLDYQLERYARVFGSSALSSQPESNVRSKFPRNTAQKYMWRFARTESGLRTNGKNSIVLGSWADAVYWYELLRDHYQPKVNDYFNLGVALTAERRYKEAVVELLESIRLDRNKAEARLALARVYLTTGENFKARLQYRWVLNNAPDYKVDALQGVGRVHANLREFSDAKGVLLSAVRLDRSRGDIYEDLVKVCADLGEYRLARRFISRSEETGFVVEPELKRAVVSLAQDSSG